MSRQRIVWLGHGSWKLVTINGTAFYIDPYITGNPSCPITLEDTGDADVVCVTHGHDDHLRNAIEIVKKTGAVLVTLPNIGHYAARHGIPYDDRGGILHTGGSIRQKDCVIRAVHALHSADIFGYEFLSKKEISVGSGSCGFMMEPDGGKTVYFAGDTGLFGDMKLLGELYKPYAAVLPVGDKYTMGIREGAYAAKLIGAKYVIPGHYNTFPAITQDMDKFRKLVSEYAPDCVVSALSPGEAFEF